MTCIKCTIRNGQTVCTCPYTYYASQKIEVPTVQFGSIDVIVDINVEPGTVELRDPDGNVRAAVKVNSMDEFGPVSIQRDMMPRNLTEHEQKEWRCAPLLPAPGDGVARDLLKRISVLRTVMATIIRTEPLAESQV